MKCSICRTFIVKDGLHVDDEDNHSPGETQRKIDLHALAKHNGDMTSFKIEACMIERFVQRGSLP